MATEEHKNHQGSGKGFEISGYCECKHFLQKQFSYKIGPGLGLAVIFLFSGGRSIVLLSLQLMSDF